MTRENDVRYPQQKHVFWIASPGQALETPETSGLFVFVIPHIIDFLLVWKWIVFWVSHCLFWVLDVKRFIHSILFGFSVINPIFAMTLSWSLACFESMEQLSQYSSEDSLYWDLHHTLLMYVSTYPWCRVHNLKNMVGPILPRGPRPSTNTLYQ